MASQQVPQIEGTNGNRCTGCGKPLAGDFWFCSNACFDRVQSFTDETTREAAILEQEDAAQAEALASALADLRAMSDLFLDAKATIEEGLAMAGEARRKLGETGPEPTEDFPRPMGVLKAEARAHAERVHVPGRMFVR